MRALWVLAAVLFSAALVRSQYRDPVESITRLAPGSAATDGVVVTVRNEDDEPIAGASVAILPVKSMFSREGRLLRERLIKSYGVEASWVTLAFVSRLGRRYTTGGDGTVVLPNEQAYSLVAVSGRSAAAMRINKGAETVRVRVVPLVELPVHVIDGKGRPVRGVPVTWSINARMLGQMLAPVSWTNADGVAYLPKLPQMSVTSKPVAIGVLFLGDEQVVAEASVHSARPDQSVELRMPEFGMLKVVRYDENKAGSAPEIQSARVVILDDRDRDWWSRAVNASVIERDSALFPCVKLGARFRVELSMSDGTEVEIEGDGPTRSREMKILTTTNADERYLGMRVLDRKGEPLTRCKLGVALVTDADSYVVESRTDRDGRLSLKTPDHLDGGPCRVVVSRVGMLDVPLSSAIREIEGYDERRSELALGDVQLGENPLLFSGRVVDRDGKPIAAAVVRAGDVYEPRKQQDWGGAAYRSAVARTARDGVFTLRHACGEVPSFEVEASGWYLVDAPAIGLGDRDVELVMGRTGSIVGEVADPPKQDLFLTVALESDPFVDHTTPMNADGTFRFDDIEPGSYVVSWQATGGEIGKVEVREGKVCRDDALTALDWRKTMMLCKVTAKLAGDAKGQVKITRWAGKPRRHGYGSSIRAGESRSFFLDKESGYLEISSHGYIAQTVENPGEVVEVELRRQSTVNLRFVGELELPKDVSLTVELVEPNKKRDTNSGSRVPRLRKGAAAVYVDEPGEYWLRLGVHVNTGHHNFAYVSPRNTVEHSIPNLDVDATAFERGIDIKVDDELRRAIADLAKKVRDR